MNSIDVGRYVVDYCLINHFCRLSHLEGYFADESVLIFFQLDSAELDREMVTVFKTHFSQLFKYFQVVFLYSL